MGKHKNILYIGPYREFGGAGNSARNYIQALFESGHDVCIAPIFYTGDTYPENEISSDILPLENNHLKHYDIVIQHCNPFDYVYSNKFDINIGIYQFNNSTLNNSVLSRLNLMDRIVVNSNFNFDVINRSAKQELIDKVLVCPELINLNLKDKQYIKYPWINPNSVVFYTIADLIERKNIQKIITAFLYTFRTEDSAELIIKTKPHYSHREKDLVNKEIHYMIDKIYRILRLEKNQCKQPKIMVGSFEYEAVLSVHNNANIYVDASMAENFGYSVLEAALFDNYLIVNENSSTAEISSSCFLTESRSINTIDSYTNMFMENTIDQYWYDVDFHHLCSNMQTAYLSALGNKCVSHDLTKYGYQNVENILI